MEWNVVYAQSVSGKVWVRDFVNALPIPVRVRVKNALLGLKYDGPYQSPPAIKKIDAVLYELRVVGKSQIRVLYTVNGKQIILLQAFIKKSRKISKKDLLTAKRRA